MAKWEYTDKPMHSEHRKADPRYVDKDMATQCLHAGERWEKQYFWTSSTPILTRLHTSTIAPKTWTTECATASLGTSTLERARRPTPHEWKDIVPMLWRWPDSLKIIRLIVNPARITHHWLSEEELAAIGIRPGTFRMSVGIENIEDLKEDLDQALKACR